MARPKVRIKFDRQKVLDLRFSARASPILGVGIDHASKSAERVRMQSRIPNLTLPKKVLFVGAVRRNRLRGAYAELLSLSSFATGRSGDHA